MTSTEPLPMLEAVGEVLAEMEDVLELLPRFPIIAEGFAASAETFARLLALRGWRLVPIGVVNADEVVATEPTQPPSPEIPPPQNPS